MNQTPFISLPIYVPIYSNTSDNTRCILLEPTSLRLDFARALEAFVMDEVRLSPLPNGALTGSALE